ncbi:two-partner secretion domain-containing protein [Anabaena subtropica]|uniref:Filamentous hemagglutinin N-terminal domain-containing protein n=1 Tax=Anabaena subtropica FACHB-260 TaxID=2692884 RepID=A0ABR8CTS5_9NOST|nr:filamentous hemagglutinin N-terminal domain-containing protein [Anabaena subtropica]MBD2346582.1 filamentous hemagglutinin N-terminal domain-containing protein [Anabaena subtropica FACHB-260]
MKSAFLLWNFIILFWLFSLNPIKAEIIPDDTLPTNSTVRPVGNIRVIEGGTQRGANLFHSFREFSFSVLTSNSTGNTAVFNHNLAVQNIITRITGGSPSYIDGMIAAITGSRANLFFINPQGIILGANASLNIGGSFVATTANSLRFADGTEFSATAHNNIPSLTVSVPVGLQFGNTPGNIEQPISDYLPVGLQVENGQTLALIGGNLLLESSILEAPGGRIELGSVAGDGFVNLSEIDQGYSLGYSGVENFGDIKLAAGTLVNPGSLPIQDSGGAIQIQGRNIIIDDSLVFAVNFGSNTGDRLIINATESLKLDGFSNILTVAQDEGNAGDIWIRAKDFIELGEESFIGSQVCSLGGNCENVTGNGGHITIETRRLLLRDGGGIEASTFGAGNTGNILVKATDSIDLIGESSDGDIPSGIFAQVARDATENAGNTGTITLETKRLNIQGGAQISNTARYGGHGGNVIINASESIQVSGASQFATTSPLDIFRSGIFVSTQLETTTSDSTLNINTGLLTVENGARITGDNLNIVADRLIVQDGAKVTLNRASGNLSITERSLTLDNQEQAPLEQILDPTNPNQLDSERLPTNDIITFSQTNPSFNTPEVDSSRRFAQLPTNPLDTSRQITPICSSDSKKQPVLKASLREELQTKNSANLSHLLTISNFTPINVVEDPDSHKIVEAQGWVIDTNGNITLVAQTPTVNDRHPWLSSTICHIHE